MYVMSDMFFIWIYIHKLPKRIGKIGFGRMARNLYGIIYISCQNNLINEWEKISFGRWLCCLYRIIYISCQDEFCVISKLPLYV